MSHSSNQKQQSPLDTLQSMINGVLIETGKALRSANLKGVQTIGHTHDRLQTFIPNALDKFHLALDDLESDVVRAKAVLERDLRELRARRKALDNLVVEEYPESLPISAADVQNTPASHTPTDLQTKPVLENESKDTDMDDNIATVDTGTPHPTVEDNSVLLPPKSIQDEIETDKHGSLEKSMQQVKTEGPAVLDSAQQANQDLSNKSTATGLSLDLSLAVSSAASEAPLTSGLQSSTLGSMFDSGNHGDSNLNFDFDFTTDGPGNQSLDFGGNSGDLDLSSFGGQANSNQENMLPDLDVYDNSRSSDINILDLSNSTNNQNGDQGGDSNADDLGMSGDLDITMGIEADESNFDEMVNAMEFSDTADDGGQFDTYFAFNDL